MKPRWLALPCLLAFGPAAKAQTPVAAAAPPAPSTVKAESLRLIRQDAAATRQNDAKSADANPTVPPDNHTLILERLVVREKRLPPLPPPPPPESKLQEVLRTGTIWQNKKGTVRFWARGDKGLMLTIYP